MKSRLRRRRVKGLIPWLGQGLLALGRTLAGHPQPLLLGGLLLLSGWALWSHLECADAFRITQVVLPPQSSLTLPAGVLQANLWRVDIRALADELQQQQPWLKAVRVVRRPPNVLWIDAIARVPVAQVRFDSAGGGTGRWPSHLPHPPEADLRRKPQALWAGAQVGGWYPLDREGFILPQGSAEPSARLVRVVGLDRLTVGLHVGTRSTDDRLSLALRVLEKLRRAPPAVARRLTEINVADPQQIRFVMDGATEVRCGSETELDAHLARLRAALKVLAKQPMAARYIDVRFPEPVIGPRT